MSLTGEGTLTFEETLARSSGYVVLLKRDLYRRPVVCFATSRKRDIDAATLRRIVFYMGSVLSEKSEAQTEGVVVLVNFSKPEDLGEILLESIALLLENLPINLHSLHFVVSSDSDSTIPCKSVAAEVRSFV